MIVVVVDVGRGNIPTILDGVFWEINSNAWLLSSNHRHSIIINITLNIIIIIINDEAVVFVIILLIQAWFLRKCLRVKKCIVKRCNTRNLVLRLLLVLLLNIGRIGVCSRICIIIGYFSKIRWDNLTNLGLAIT